MFYLPSCNANFLLRRQLEVSSRPGTRSHKAPSASAATPATATSAAGSLAAAAATMLAAAAKLAAVASVKLQCIYERKTTKQKKRRCLCRTPNLQSLSQIRLCEFQRARVYVCLRLSWRMCATLSQRLQKLNKTKKKKYNNFCGCLLVIVVVVS